MAHKHKSHRKAQYESNKAAKVGETIICPICGKAFTKKQWQQAFCCGTCKDRYWNDKGDRHADPNYHAKYNQKHPERYIGLIGLGETKAEREHNTALYHLATDEDFRRYVNDVSDNFSGDWDSHDVPGETIEDLWEQYENEGIDLM